MSCFTRCWDDVDQSQNDAYINETMPEVLSLERENLCEESSCMGRAWKWLNEPGTGRLNLAVRGVIGTVNLTAFTVTAFFTAQQFLSDERNRTRAMLFGVGLGIPITILTGCVLPEKWAAALANWLCRWSYEGLQILTQFYLNGGCPIGGNGFWDPLHVPLAVKELATILFTGVSVSIALLSLRTLLFPPEEKEEESDMLEQDPEPILMLESGKDDKKWLAGEQLVKLTLGASLIWMVRANVIQVPELLFLGNYLIGHLGGVVLGECYHYLNGKVLEYCPVKQGILSRIDKVGRVFSASSYATLFAWTSPESFIAFGLISGVSKVITLHKFQLLKKNDEEVAPFEWCRVDNIAKGALAGLFLAWYISGMTDVGLRFQDYLNIITYLTTTIGSYPLTRYLAGGFDPGNNSRLFNTLRFYFVNHQEVLYLPYMLIRSAQSIGDDHKDTGAFAIAQDMVAWASFGLASGNNRALMGMRSHQSPNEMSSLAELVAWFILASQAKFR